jgi:hypothetical protein
VAQELEMCSPRLQEILSQHDLASRHRAAKENLMRNFSLAFLTLTLIGCGDGSLTLDTGVAPRTPLSEITDGDATKICLALGDYIGDLIPQSRVERIVCTIAGAAAEAALGGSGQCEVTRDQCLENPPEVETFDANFVCDEIDAGVFAGCDGATVGDLEDCFSDVGARVDRILGQITCSNIGGDPTAGDDLLEDFVASFDEANQPESCRRLSDACPGFTIFE